MRQPGASTPAAMSRAVQLGSFGGPEVLNLREVPAPQAGSGQIRVRVTAAGLNPMDWFHDLRRRDRHSIRLEPAVRLRNRLCRGRGPVHRVQPSRGDSHADLPRAGLRRGYLAEVQGLRAAE